MSTAQAFTAGQGQTVMIAGVSVGEIGKVDAEGRPRAHRDEDQAQVHADLQGRDDPVAPEDRPERHDARDGPGQQDRRRAARRAAPSRSRRRCRTSTRTSSSPASTPRRATTSSCCVGGAGQGLQGNAANLSATLKRFDPTGALRHADHAAARRAPATTSSRSIHNFRLLAGALGDKDTQLGRVRRLLQRGVPRRSRTPRRACARRSGSCRRRSTATNDALVKSRATLTDVLGPALDELQPAAEGLAPALEAFQSFAKETKPAIENQIGPFTVTAQPTARRPAARRGRPRATSSRSSPTASRSSTSSSTASPTTRRASRRATCTGWPGPTTWPPRCSSSQDAQRPDAARRPARLLRLAAGVRGRRQGERDPRHARHAAQRAVVPVGLRREGRRSGHGARDVDPQAGRGPGRSDPAATLKALGEKPAAVTAKTSSTTGGTPAPAAGR